MDKIIIKDERHPTHHITTVPRVENGFRQKRGRISENAYIKNNKAYVTFEHKLIVGDMISLKGVHKDLYIKKFEGFGKTRKGGFKFEVGRVDKFPVSNLEIEKIKENTIFLVYGYFSECKKCN